jgi:hypothetical protein
MKCTNCERSIGTFALRCRVCHQRRRLWYILVILLLLAGFVAILLLLELN